MSTAVAPPPVAGEIVANAVAGLGEIATLPEVTVRIIQIVENPKSTARDLHDIIRHDPALSARILKVVNSAFYGLPGQIASTDRAVALLGLSAVKNIAIAASMTHLFNAGARGDQLFGTDLWRHSIAIGVAARMLSAAQGKPAVEESFLAGLLCDIGILIERQAFPRQLAEGVRRHREENRPFCDLENELIGADHQAFGMALATKWRFPGPLCNTIGYHHRPAELAPAHRELPTLVHLADIIASQAGIGFGTTRATEKDVAELLPVLNLGPDAVEQVAASLAEHVAVTESLFVD